MVFKFTYFYNGNVFRETYTEEGKALIKYSWLVSHNVAFRLLTFTPRHSGWR